MCHVDNLKYDDLIKNIDFVWERKEELMASLREQDKELKEKALSNVKMALDLLEIGD